MPSIILLNKPFGILSQFSGDDPSITLTPYINTPNVYPAGRLDRDSEGLLLLTDDGRLQHKISDPRFDKEKTYWAQVEGEITEEALRALRNGLSLKDGTTKPAKARLLQEPTLWARTPPIRERKAIPTSWVEIIITEGRNRQVRRMTAATGFPTLRLVRMKIGEWELGKLKPGESKQLIVLCVESGFLPAGYCSFIRAATLDPIFSFTCCLLFPERRTRL